MTGAPSHFLFWRYKYTGLIGENHSWEPCLKWMYYFSLTCYTVFYISPGHPAEFSQTPCELYIVISSPRLAKRASSIWAVLASEQPGYSVRCHFEAGNKSTNKITWFLIFYSMQHVWLHIKHSLTIQLRTKFAYIHTLHSIFTLYFYCWTISYYDTEVQNLLLYCVLLYPGEENCCMTLRNLAKLPNSKLLTWE